MCAQRGEQRGENRDYDVHYPLDGLLRTIFHD